MDQGQQGRNGGVGSGDDAAEIAAATEDQTEELDKECSDSEYSTEEDDGQDEVDRQEQLRRVSPPRGKCLVR